MLPDEPLEVAVTGEDDGERPLVHLPDDLGPARACDLGAERVRDAAAADDQQAVRRAPGARHDEREGAEHAADEGCQQRLQRGRKPKPSRGVRPSGGDAEQRAPTVGADSASRTARPDREPELRPRDRQTRATGQSTTERKMRKRRLKRSPEYQ